MVTIEVEVEIASNALMEVRMRNGEARIREGEWGNFLFYSKHREAP